MATSTVAAAVARLGVRELWLIPLGVLGLLLGVVGLFLVIAHPVVSAVWYGVLLGILGAAHVLTVVGKDGRFGDLVLGLVYVAAAVFIAANPLATSQSLILLIGLALTGLGLARAIWAFWFPGVEQKHWGVLGGFLSVAIGVMVVLGSPFSHLCVIGLLISTDMIIYGLTLSGIGWKNR